MTVGDVAELDGGFGDPGMKSCGVDVVELHFYLSNGGFLLGFGIGKEQLKIGLSCCWDLFGGGLELALWGAEIVE